MATRPKIGLALGAGAARGLAHLGVLKVLEKYKIPVDFVAGSSMGALVGALYCAGLEADFLIKFARELPSRSWVDLALPRSGLISGKKVETMLQMLTRNRDFSQLKIPFAAVATDIERGEAVVLKEGNVAAAVRASISIPVVFKPVRLGQRLLVDGGVVDRVPVSVVREMGADVVIAVDVNKFVSYQPVKNIIDVMLQTLDIMERKILDARVLDTEVLIRPKVGHISPAHFHRVDELVQAGVEATEAAISKIGYVLRCRLPAPAAEGGAKSGQES
ncbi:MAG: patatin family protein [Firmicutes bacterium]|nr:patatin family protein [Bacillota bacterium]HOB35227.1 patatin-like phospholipase family protein [Bacillota bacterium]HPZ89877.1 patatin-like phospholipase family protein [Bacillota bacterium]HQE01107.1 patatin-like phospholipase family protein [Bacillota bacterium]